MLPEIGQTVSRYQILAKLGEGGMGVVFKAEDVTLKRLVALKFLSSKVVGDSVARARLIREAQAAGCLDHPNICQVYGFEECAGAAFIVMAFVDGPSLADLVRAGIPLDAALDYAIQAGEGLKAAHDRGIVHRDIKAANVLTRDGCARLTDFGLARIQDRSRLTEPGTVMGTIVCLAPEQIMAQEADARTDIWAFGVMLYEMCTGRQPFARATLDKSIDAILNAEPARPGSLVRELPADLDWILAKMLAKDRANRYQHMDDAVVDLRGLRAKLTPAQKQLQASIVADPAAAPTATAVSRTWLSKLFSRLAIMRFSD